MQNCIQKLEIGQHKKLLCMGLYRIHRCILGSKLILALKTSCTSYDVKSGIAQEKKKKKKAMKILTVKNMSSLENNYKKEDEHCLIAVSYLWIQTTGKV